jgi:hypothetical protein
MAGRARNGGDAQPAREQVSGVPAEEVAVLVDGLKAGQPDLAPFGRVPVALLGDDVDDDQRDDGPELREIVRLRRANTFGLTATAKP